jgi:hypothetical protein
MWFYTEIELKVTDDVKRLALDCCCGEIKQQDQILLWRGQTMWLSIIVLQLLGSSCEQRSMLCQCWLHSSKTTKHFHACLRETWNVCAQSAIQIACGSWDIICSPVHLLSWLCAYAIKLNVLNALIVIQTKHIERNINYSFCSCEMHWKWFYSK